MAASEVKGEGKGTVPQRELYKPENTHFTHTLVGGNYLRREMISKQSDK